MYTEPKERTSTLSGVLGLPSPDLGSSWLIAIRLSFLGLALFSASIFTFFTEARSPEQLKEVFYLIALLFGFCAISSIWLAARRFGVVFNHIQLLADILIITGVVHITGGTISPFLFLYLPIVMSAAVVCSRTTAFATAFYAIAAYSALLFALYSGWLMPADGSLVPETPRGGVALQIIGLGSALFLIAVATSYLSKKIDAGLRLVELSRLDLAALTDVQRQLMNDLPDGIVTVDNSQNVVSVNTSVCRLLGISSEEAVGRPVREIFERMGVSGEKLPVDMRSTIETREFDLSQGNGSEKRVLVYGKALDDDRGALVLFQDVTEIRSIEEQLAVQERMTRLLSERAAQAPLDETGLKNFVGESPVMKKVFSLIRRVSQSDATVLIGGGSGTGKELVARAIHSGSARNRGPFIAVNCGAIPETLIESQLFGHKKGSFTGADADAVGFFQQAAGGTIFLDEIGELPLLMQPKLLRAVQEKTIRPVGGDRDIPIDVRIVAATNRNLKKEVENGSFREDLFYRLNVISIKLPDLRDRREDIPLLVNSIMQKLVKDDATPAVSPAAMRYLMQYDYPGNVRELENIIERAVVLGGEVVLPEHLPENVTFYQPSLAPTNGQAETKIIIDEKIEFPLRLDDILADLERKYLEAALKETSGAKKKAADLLGINFRSFRYRLQKFSIGE